MKDFAEKLIKRLDKITVLIRPVGWSRKIEVVETKAVIEIINEIAGEYDNDFCEWFKYDYRTITPKHHDAENPYWRIPENLDKLKYCPYCGKKIKVLPY